MTVDRIHVLVEEPSMESMLQSLLPKLVGNLAFEIFRYNPTARALFLISKWLRRLHR
jgi:hypothetical protein